MAGLDDIFDNVDAQRSANIGSNASAYTGAPQANSFGLDSIFDHVDSQLGVKANPRSQINSIIQSSANPFEKGASGFLAGAADIGDLADTIENYSPTNLITSLFTNVPKQTAGNDLRSFFDSATGVKDSTKIGDDSYAHMFGKFLPGALLGGEETILNGTKSLGEQALPFLGETAKKIGFNGLMTGGGYGGREIDKKLGGSGVTGEIIGSTAAALSPGYLAKKLSSTATSIYDTMLGFDASKGKIKGFKDAAGNIVPEAVAGGSQFSKADPLIDTLRTEFIPKISLSDTVSDVSNKLSIFKQTANKDLDGIVDAASVAEKELFNTFAPHENAAYLDVTKPDFSVAQKYIDGVADSTVQESLQKILDKTTTDLGKKGYSVDAFKDFKSSFGFSNKKSFNATSNLEDTAKTDLNNMIYGALADSTQSKIDLIGQATGNDFFSSAFSSANKEFSAAATFEDKAFKASRQTSGGAIKEALLSPFTKKPVLATLAAAGAPVQTAKALDGLSAVTRLFSPGNIAKGGGLGALVASLYNSEESKADPLNSLASRIYDQNTLTKTDLPVTSARPNLESNFAGDIEVKPLPKNATKQNVVARIDSNPLDKTIFEMESNRNKAVTNSQSSAKGAFQLIDSTANKLGVKDVFDLADNYKGFQALKNENQARFGDDPIDLYGAHFLGATIYGKYLKGQSLTDKQQELVDQWESIVRPRFVKKYAANVKLINGVTDV